MKKKILVADDDAEILEVFQIIFSNAGYDVTLLSTGTPIMDSDYLKPDLFVLDRQLSGLDGLDICRYLKSRENTRNIPVIIVSATPGLKLLAFRAGADDSLEKPFSVAELLDKVEKQLFESALV